MVSRPTFIDTWGWIALGRRKDPRHTEAAEYYKGLVGKHGRSAAAEAASTSRPPAARNACQPASWTPDPARHARYMAHFALYKRIYDQRTATERINSLATDLGIERPYLRNQQAITNQNTFIYVLLNLRALHRVRRQKACPQT